MFATEQQTEEIPIPLADIIREETDDGRLVVRFLIDIMQGKVDDSKPCHRLDAARQLLNLGFHGAQTVIQSVSRSTGVRAPSSTLGKSRFDQGIADIIKLETSDGRDAVRFLVDVMQGNLQDFKPHHRIAAAKELLRRGFDNSHGNSDDGEHEDEGNDEAFDDDPGSPNYAGGNSNRYNNEDDPFDFENYDEEQFRRDGDGGRALRHIYGNRETMIVAIDAANHHRCNTRFDETHIPDRDFTPIDNPEDDPYGKGHATDTTLCAFISATTRPSEPPTRQSKNTRNERPNAPKKNQKTKDRLSIARPPTPQKSLVILPPKTTTQYLPITGLINTWSASAIAPPKQTNPLKTRTPMSPNPTNSSKTRTPASPRPTNYPTPRTRPGKDP